MDTTIPIQPVGFYPSTAAFVHVNDVYIHLASQTADCQVTFLDTGRAPINASAQRYHLDTGAYAGWGSTDSYLIDCVIAGLGLTPV